MPRIWILLATPSLIVVGGFGGGDADLLERESDSRLLSLMAKAPPPSCARPSLNRRRARNLGITLREGLLYWADVDCPNEVIAAKRAMDNEHATPGLA